MTTKVKKYIGSNLYYFIDSLIDSFLCVFHFPKYHCIGVTNNGPITEITEDFRGINSNHAKHRFIEHNCNIVGFNFSEIYCLRLSKE